MPSITSSTSSLWPRWLWLRALGLIFLSAFYSLYSQITGLIGPRGILPAGEYLRAVRDATALPWWAAPTLYWLGSSDGVLLAVVLLGAAASLLLVANVAPRACIAVALICFLSFVSVGQEFAGYQSDGMLLEAGFLSLFYAPRGLRPGLGAPASRLPLFLLLWEWFRIYFESGVVKLLSGDEQWRNLTALDHYYENGPLPTWLGWYLQQLLPHGFHAGTAALTFVVELGVALLMFGPPRARRICFWLVTPFQAVIILTANYAFLNYIVLALGVLLLDTGPWVPSRWPARALLGWIFLATLLVAPGLSHLIPRPLRAPAAVLEPFRVANRYGLFAVMTRDRFEIEFQHSEDGEHWTPYGFRYKPQDVQRAPGIYAPYQPRFEWNLWFAALSSWRSDVWVLQTEVRLLEGSPEVLQLFAKGGPEKPRFVRAVKWQYWFTTPAERRASGAWWKREERGLYAPELTLDGGEPKAVRLP